MRSGLEVFLKPPFDVIVLPRHQGDHTILLPVRPVLESETANLNTIIVDLGITLFVPLY